MATTVQVGAPSDIPTPSGDWALFVNTAAGNRLYFKLPDDTVQPATSLSAGEVEEIAEKWMEGAKCALTRGIITAAEFEAIITTGLSITESTNTDQSGNTTVSFSIGSRDVALISISLDASTFTGAALSTHQIVVTFNPTNTSNRTVTFVSSDPTKATVSASGLITGVATGPAIISVIPNADPSKAKTVSVTIT